MVEFCYSNHIGAVGIVGPSAEIFSNFHSHENFAIILFDNASIVVHKDYLDHLASRHKLQVFLVSISPVKNLTTILKELRTSKWWNHMASFLIIDNSTSSDQGCSKAFKILRTAWKMNLLYAKFICHDKSKGPLMYSYNPYTNQAPIPWHANGTYNGTHGIKHPWTLLVQSYQDSQKICSNLDFDQAKDLDHYKIRTGVFSSNRNSSRTRVKGIHALNQIILVEIFRVLKSRIRVLKITSDKRLFKLTRLGLIDISLDPWLMKHYTNMQMTYPHGFAEVAFITQRRGNLSQIEKLLRVIDPLSRYAIVLVCFITFIFLKFFLRQSVTSAILTVVRLICNAAIPNLPNNIATRIYLSGLFIFMMSLQGFYQGNMASLLTKPMALPNVQTLEDLQNFNYTIYGNKYMKFYFKNWSYRGRVVSLHGSKCVQYVLRDDSAACVNYRHQLIHMAKKYDLHLGDTITPRFLAYIIREDWPLEKRFNIMISHLVESNIVEYLFMKYRDPILRKKKFHEKEKEHQDFTAITLKDLSIAFSILGIGFTCATIVFFVEVWIER